MLSSIPCSSVYLGLSQNCKSMTEFFKADKYKPEFQAAVEARQKKPIIAIETVRKENGEEINVVDIAGVKFESFASREDLEAIIATISATPESLEILQAMALTSQQSRGLINEGPTSRGKTYLFNRFTELKFGKGVRPVDFYCNGQTDTMSLMAKWVPKTEDSEDEARWARYTESAAGRSALKGIIEGARKETQGAEEIQKQFVELAKHAGITKTVSQWQFQYGALPRAMTMPKHPTKSVSADNPPRGIYMHIQEVGLAETHVIDALLQLGGEKGRLAGEIQLWEDGGRPVPSGPEFWIYYSTNEPENYPNRQGIDQALARRNTFLKLGAESSASRQFKQYLDNGVPFERMPQSLRAQIEAGQKNVIFPISASEGAYSSADAVEMRLLVSDVLSDFHEKLKGAMADKSIEQRTKQKFELTDDEWNMVYDFMRRFESPDLEATLDRAVYFHYIARFTEKGQEHAWRYWEEIKRNKDFKKRLEKTVPKEKAVRDAELWADRSRFLGDMREVISGLEQEIALETSNDVGSQESSTGANKKRRLFGRL